MMAISQRIQLGVLAVTGFLVLVLGLGVLGSILSSNPIDSNEIPASIIMRGPASANIKMENQASAIHMIDQKMSQLNLNCIKPDQKIELASQAQQVQITGKYCGEQNLATSEVINETNGFKAVSFKLKQNAFTTDYLQLSDGQNKIEIKLTGEGGEVLKAELNIEKHNPKVTEESK